MKTIVLDVDGVLLSYEPSLREYALKKLNVSHLPERKEMEYIEEFSFSPDFSQIPSIPGALEALQELKALGYKIVCLTASNIAIDSVRLRRDNLRTNFPGLISDIFHNGEMSKGQYCKAMSSIYDVHAFVDDFGHNLRSLEDYGFQGTMIRFNPDHEGCGRFHLARNWSEALDIIKRGVGSGWITES